jgi:hypothetical protein
MDSPQEMKTVQYIKISSEPGSTMKQWASLQKWKFKGPTYPQNFVLKHWKTAF